jgi:hypothetical protein
MYECVDIIAQKKGFLMHISVRIWLFLLFCIAAFAAEIPRTIQYQGRFLDAATNLPVQGTVSKQITVYLRAIDSAGVLGQNIFSHTANNVTIRDGVFNVEIPVPSNVLFEQPYAIEVVVQGSGGGNVGAQKLKSVPYAFTAQNALKLGGMDASQYAPKTHSHTKITEKLFTIDGTGENLLPNSPQFMIKNGNGQPVFEVNASGDLAKVNRIEVADTIETAKGIRVMDENGQFAFEAYSNGNVNVHGDLTVHGASTVGSLQVTGTAKLEKAEINGILTFGPNASINVDNKTTNVISLSHTIEQHADSPLLRDIKVLSSGATLLSTQYHTHSFAASSITSTAIGQGVVLSTHIKDGEITNADISPTASIADTKLATITTKIITMSALPSEVVSKNDSNTFGAGFDVAGRIQYRTTNEFDGLKAKLLYISPPNSGSTDPNLITTAAIQIGDSDVDGMDFEWRIERDGTLKMNVKGDPKPRIMIGKDSSAGSTKTSITLRNIVFSGSPDLINSIMILLIIQLLISRLQMVR